MTSSLHSAFHNRYCCKAAFQKSGCKLRSLLRQQRWRKNSETTGKRNCRFQVTFGTHSAPKSGFDHEGKTSQMLLSTSAPPSEEDYSLISRWVWASRLRSQFQNQDFSRTATSSTSVWVLVPSLGKCNLINRPHNLLISILWELQFCVLLTFNPRIEKLCNS